MKILFITPFFYPVKGGMEEHVLQISRELIKRNHEVIVYTSNLSREGKISNKGEIYKKIKIKRFNSLFKIGNFASFFPGMFREIKKENPDIIHVHSYRHPSNLIPLFTQKHCFITLHWPNYPKGLRNKFNDIIIPIFDKIIGKFLLNKYKKLIAVNGLEVDWLKNKMKINQNKISLIPNGIPKEYLKIRNKNFKEKLNIKNKLLILSLCRIHKSKGLDLIIKVSKFFPKVKFIIAGPDGGYLEELKHLKEKLKVQNVIFTGEIKESDKLNLISSADIFLFPSHYEAFGIVILEAFSQKVPVISSDSGGLPWVIDNAGLVFEDNNLEDLKIKLGKLLNNKILREKYSKLGYERARMFTWDKIVDKLENEYKKI